MDLHLNFQVDFQGDFRLNPATLELDEMNLLILLLLRAQGRDILYKLEIRRYADKILGGTLSGSTIL